MQSKTWHKSSKQAKPEHNTENKKAIKTSGKMRLISNITRSGIRKQQT